jgi:hypothetical protein
MIMTDIKLCKDCKHYKRDWSARITGFGDTFDLCLHPALTGNLVTAKNNGRYCDSMRKYHECGMEGKLWEARK